MTGPRAGVPARTSAWALLTALVLLVGLATPGSAQTPAQAPRVVLEPAAGVPVADLADLTGLPAAWRVPLALSAADDEQDDGRDVAALDAASPRGPVWVALQAGEITAERVPALVARVRNLVTARPSIRVVDLALDGIDPRVGDFVVRRLSVDVKAVRDDLLLGVAVTPDGPWSVDGLADRGLTPLVDVLVLASHAEVPAARARLGARGIVLQTAVLAQPLGDEQATVLARAEVARLGGAPDIAGYVVESPSVATALLRVVRALARWHVQEVTRVEADLRVTAGEADVAATWNARVYFAVDSLATVVALEVPEDAPRDVSLRLVLPVAGAVVLVDPVSGTERPLPSRRDEAAQATEVPLTLPANGVWLIDFNRDADTSFVQREDVSARRSLTLEEILARHQLRQAADRQAVRRYIADGTMQQYFRPTVTDPGFDVFTENRYFVDGDETEWEERSFSVNGARWDENRPPFPLLQPEKVLAPPLVIALDARYRYRLGGTARVEDIDCYVVRFEPADDTRSLYRGTVWIARDTFVLVKQQVVQTNLSAPVVSNDETQTFAPVTLASGRTVFLPSRSYNQQLVLIAGRNLLVERRMTFSDYVIDPDDFEARRLEARRSDHVMYRDTDQGVRYFVKSADGSTRVVSDRSTTTAKAQAIGVTIDPSYSFPLPILGINYLNFEFLGRKDTQLAVLFGGVLAAGNLQRPQIIGRRVDLNIDFFAIAAPGSDRFYDPEGERSDERLLNWPLSTGINLGFQATSYQKVTAQYQFRFDGFVRDRTTADDYTTPSSTVTNGLGVLYEYRRAGYNLTASGVFARRASWRPWGAAGALEASSPDYEKYAINATKTFYFGPFSKIVVNGAWFTGRRLDRFSRYQFGLFDETRLRGVPSSGVRYGELAMGRGQYSFNIFEQYRLDLFVDRAWGRTRDIGVPWEGLTGIGAAVNVRIPGRNLILRADVGKSFLPDRYRRLGSTVVQVLLLRPLS